MQTLIGSEQLVDPEGLIKLVLRLGIDLVVCAFVVWGVHFRKNRRTDFLFTYGALNVLTFALCFLLRKVPMDLGMGLGLFAVFGILRYRTEAIGIRELTYLFVVIGVAILNAASNKSISVAELVVANVAVCTVVFLLDGAPWTDREITHNVLYDRVELTSPVRRKELLADLSARLGVRVERVQVARVDLLKDTVEITAFSSAPPPAMGTRR
jgi:hypothetical protein